MEIQVLLLVSLQIAIQIRIRYIVCAHFNCIIDNHNMSSLCVCAFANNCLFPACAVLIVWYLLASCVWVHVVFMCVEFLCVLSVSVRVIKPVFMLKR